MSRKISISTENFEIEAELLEDVRPKTCEKIWESLSLEGEARKYKEEFYFNVPVDIEPEDATPNTEKGDIAYWPEGSAFCIFYGSSQPASPVSTFAKIVEGTEKFEDVEKGEKIRVMRSE